MAHFNVTLPRTGFCVNVVRRVPTIRHNAHPWSHHALPNVIRSDKAYRYQASVPVALVAMSREPVVGDHVGQGDRGISTASPLAATGGEGLAGLQCVDTVQGNELRRFLDGIVVDDAGLAGDAGVGGGGHRHTELWGPERPGQRHQVAPIEHPPLGAPYRPPESRLWFRPQVCRPSRDATPAAPLESRMRVVCWR